jgi:hypothetical protein
VVGRGQPPCGGMGVVLGYGRVVAGWRTGFAPCGGDRAGPMRRGVGCAWLWAGRCGIGERDSRCVVWIGQPPCGGTGVVLGYGRVVAVRDSGIRTAWSGEGSPPCGGTGVVLDYGRGVAVWESGIRTAWWGEGSPHAVEWGLCLATGGSLRDRRAGFALCGRARAAPMRRDGGCAWLRAGRCGVGERDSHCVVGRGQPPCGGTGVVLGYGWGVAG